MTTTYPGLLAMVVLALGAPPAIAAPEAQARPLRVVTYNLLHGGPLSGLKEDTTHLEMRLEMAIRNLKALNPDLIALQEASVTRRHGHVAERLAHRLGYHLVYASATDRVFGIPPLDALIVKLLGFKEGVAVLSRFPIVASAIYNLPRCQRWLDPRIVLQTTVETPQGPLQLFVTHTSRRAECQAAYVGALVRERRGDAPGLLLGDFNTAETSEVLIALRKEASLVDAFRSTNPDVPGHTVWQRIEVAHPTVFRRVDYIFLLNGRTAPSTVRSSRVVFDQPGQLPDGSAWWASDHYGVFAEIDLGRQALAIGDRP